MRKVLFLLMAGVMLAGAKPSALVAPDLTVKEIEKTGGKSGGEEALFSSSDILSTKKAFLFSLVIPGAGELYAKSYTKMGIFIAAEAAFIGGYAYYMHQYNVKRDEFRRYADEHWIESYYREWYDSLCALKDTNELGIEILPDERNQQYYEMIGKYDWFTLGWDDIIAREDYQEIVDSTYGIAIVTQTSEVHDEITRFLSQFKSEHREIYMEMRKDANDQYTIAKYFVGALILNHLVSAFDAAFTAKRHNDKIYQGFTGIQEIKILPSVTVHNRRPTPTITCSVVW